MAKEKKGDAEKAKQRDVTKAIALEKKLMAAEGKCWYATATCGIVPPQLVGPLGHTCATLVLTAACIQLNATFAVFVHRPAGTASRGKASRST